MIKSQENRNKNYYQKKKKISGSPVKDTRYWL